MILKQAQVGELQQYAIGEYVIPYRDIMHPDGLVRVEYYGELDAAQPTAFTKYRSRMVTFQHEYPNWATCALESITSMSHYAYVFAQFLNPLDKFTKGDDTRQWFSAATDDTEDFVVTRYAGLPMNVVVACHIAEQRNEVSGEILRGPSAPGRLASKGKMSGFYQEQYHQYTGRDESGNRLYQLQTQNDGQWACGTQLGASNPCYPTYESLWVNWDGDIRPSIHVVVYGDFGTGKSTFISTFPKPLLVWNFDGTGKDIPYWKFMEF